jgi:hypothetical protein
MRRSRSSRLDLIALSPGSEAVWRGRSNVTRYVNGDQHEVLSLCSLSLSISLLFPSICSRLPIEVYRIDRLFSDCS